jgi:hypothetical protein
VDYILIDSGRIHENTRSICNGIHSTGKTGPIQAIIRLTGGNNNPVNQRVHKRLWNFGKCYSKSLCQNKKHVFIFFCWKVCTVYMLYRGMEGVCSEC